MSKVGVIVALLVALLLTGAAMLLGGRGKAPAPTGPLLGLDPARVVEVRLTRADGRFEAVRKGTASGTWDVVLGGTGAERAWPADPARMRAALRILSTLEAADRPVDAKVESGAPEVRIGLDDGTSRAMRVSSRTLGGHVLIEVSGVPSSPRARGAWVGSDVGAMLSQTGPREWRDHSAMPGIGPDASRITLKGEKGTLSLARVQGKWGLRQPVQEAADPEAVGRLLAVLGNIAVTDFLDDGPPDRTGLDKPIAELTIESDQRDEAGKLQTTSRTLRVGQQADIAGKTVFAAVPTAGDPAGRTVIVSAEGLSGLTTDAAAYISRRSIQAAPADIGYLVVTPAGGSPRQFQRELEGWASVDPAGSTTPCTKADADAIAGVINLLTQLPADAVEVSSSWPAAWGQQPTQPIALIDCLSAGHTPVGRVGVFSAPPDGKTKVSPVVVMSGKAWRRYADDASSPLMAWLARGS